MTAQPARIVLVQVIQTSRGQKLKVLCDNNVWYLFPGLAKAIKVSAEALRARFARMHWSNPEILAANRFKAHRPQKKKAVAAPERRSSFAALGDKVRTTKLAKLAGPGLLEGASCSR